VLVPEEEDEDSDEEEAWQVQDEDNDGEQDENDEENSDADLSDGDDDDKVGATVMENICSKPYCSKLTTKFSSGKWKKQCAHCLLMSKTKRV
jgi:hypothetical protein